MRSTIKDSAALYLQVFITLLHLNGHMVEPEHVAELLAALRLGRRLAGDQFELSTTGLFGGAVF